MTHIEREKSAYLDGMGAARLGLKKDNPCIDGTIEHSRWEAGYRHYMERLELIAQLEQREKAARERRAGA